MNKYLLDTNIIIYYLNGDLMVKPLFQEIQTGLSQGLYSPITWVELLSLPSLTATEIEEIKDFLRSFNSVLLTESLLECAAEIRRNYRIKLPDALIAASALISDYTLVTRNTDDFSKIRTLKILNPFA